MIDTHCHLDLHDDPVGLARKVEATQTMCVAVTMLPSHFRLGLPHLAPYKNVHAALGLHPLHVKEGECEIDEFVELSKTCDFIGEIGLDFSREGRETKSIQVEAFSRILNSVKGGKFVSVHSREAAKDLLQMLAKNKVGPICFHYFTAGPVVAAEGIEAGHFFSFNRRMLNGKHKALLDIIPRNRVLVESDAPFLTKNPITATKNTYALIAEHWKIPLSDVVKTIAQNFTSCRTAN